MDIIKNYYKILNSANNVSKNFILIVVSKTFVMSQIKPLIDIGHFHFGENRVQESINKWSELLKVNRNLKLHFIGKLQTNKVSQAINHFSFVHSLDSEKLALKISSEEKNYNKKLDYFVQINIGNEKQKSGISIQDSSKYINFCKNELKINIIGLMCLPPINDCPIKYFQDLKKIANDNELFNLSMGMSNDYLDALNCGANYIRIGSAILGSRKNY